MEIQNSIIRFVESAQALDDKHAPSSHGRLGLGPTSSVAVKKVIRIDTQSIELADQVPALPSGEVEKTLRVVGRDDGWFFRGRLRLGYQFGTSDEVQIAIDPSVSDLLVPQSIVKRLAVIMNLELQRKGFTSEKATIDKCGRLLVPCSKKAELQSRIGFELNGGSDYLPLDLLTPVANDSIDGPLCRTLIKMNVDDGVMTRTRAGIPHVELAEWKINPFLFERIQNVYLVARRSQIILRGHSQVPPIVGTSVRPVHIPFYSADFRFEPSHRQSVISLIPVPDEDHETPRFVLSTRFAVPGDSGRYIFFMSRYGGIGSTGSLSRQLPGVYEVQTPIMMNLEPETNELKLALTPAKPSRPGTKYTVSVEIADYLMFINFVPVGVSGTTAKTVDQDLRALGSDLANLNTSI